MGVEFDKKRMLDNISFLLKEKEKKIGELETEAGVSVGYISRTSKDENAKPGIDFILKTAEALDISVDMLLKVDLTELTPTEKYLLSFFEKLLSDTRKDKLDWKRESAEKLNRLEAEYNGYVNHPLFELETFYEQTECEYPSEETKVVFTSNYFGCHTYIAGDCFNLRMKNGTVFYMMNICKSIHKVNDMNAYAKEIWMCPLYGENQYLCGNKATSVMSSLIELLYTAVYENMKHPKIKDNIRSVIEAYLNDDFEDDVYDEELPFN